MQQETTAREILNGEKFRNATGALLVESLDPKVPFLDGSGQQDGLQFHAGIQVLLSGMALSYALGIASA